jgi:2-polyprenyl-3-methyl-5-hydroxy-6-metoxy-1,4-benzoquinol methylase
MPGIDFSGGSGSGRERSAYPERKGKGNMSIVQKIYSALHRLTTPGQEGASRVSPGYWNHRVRRAALSAIHNVKGNILDVGCGDGLFLIQLAKQNPGAHIWAVDINAEFIRQARERVNRERITTVHFSQQDAVNMAFEPGMFDAVVCTNVFMTMDSIATVRKALTSMSMVTKNGAMVFFDYRNALNPLLRLKYKLAPLYDQTIKGHNLSVYYPSDIGAGLADAHMSIIARQCVGLPLLRFLAPVIIIKARRI